MEITEKNLEKANNLLEQKKSLEIAIKQTKKTLECNCAGAVCVDVKIFGEYGNSYATYPVCNEKYIPELIEVYKNILDRYYEDVCKEISEMEKE